MAKGFFDVTAEEPAAAAGGALAKANRDAQEMQAAFSEAEKLKENILQELEAGKDPQIILYTALKTIGILTNDPEFTEKTQGKLDGIYKDLAQLSFIEDNDKKAQERLDKMQADYNDKVRRSVKRQLNAYKKVQSALYEVLDAIDNTEPKDNDDKEILI